MNYEQRKRLIIRHEAAKLFVKVREPTVEEQDLLALLGKPARRPAADSPYIAYL